MNGQSGEEAEFDDAALAFVEAGESFQSIVERDQIESLTLRQIWGVIDGKHPLAATPLCGTVTASVIHQDLPHELRRDGKEMLAILVLRIFLPEQAEIGFVHERRALEGVTGSLAQKLTSRYPAQLVIDDWQESVEAFAITLAPSL